MPLGNCSKTPSSCVKFAHYKSAKRKQASHSSLQAEEMGVRSVMKSQIPCTASEKKEKSSRSLYSNSCI